MTVQAPPANRHQCQVYERIAQTGMADGLIRPGGLQLTERALSYCSFPPPATLLDVGCGSGATVNYVRERHGFKGVGIDPSTALLSAGIARYGELPVLRACGEHLPFVARTFDGVFAECSLSLVAGLNDALRDFHRVLKTAGRLVVADLYVRTPEALADLRRLPMNCCLTGAFARDELIAALETVGFSLSLWEDHSPALKHFAAQLILSYGSPAQFRHRIGPAALDTDHLHEVVAAAKPGYFLLIAKKRV